MEIFKNKFLIKIIALMCLFFTLFNFSGINKVYAEGEEEDDDIWGGPLINPITNFMTAIGDFIMEIMHDSIQDQRQAIIKLNGASEAKTAWWTFMAIVVAIVAAVAFIVISVISAGTLTALVASVGFAATFTISIRYYTSGSSSSWNFGWNGCIQRMDSR